MPRVEATVNVPLHAEEAFAVSQSRNEIRYAWDPFVAEQTLLHGADRPAKGVQTLTKSRHRLSMVSEYTSFRPPTQVGMKMVKGPWFFSNFGGGWSFRQLDDGTTDAVWRYTFAIDPTWLSVVAEPIGLRVLQRDIDARIAAFAEACADPEIVAGSVKQLAGGGR